MGFLGLLAKARGEVLEKQRQQKFADALKVQADEDRTLDNEYKKAQLDKLRAPEQPDPVRGEFIDRPTGTFWGNPVTGEVRPVAGVPGTPRNDPVATHRANRQFDIANPLPKGEAMQGGGTNPKATDRLGQRYDRDKTVRDANVIASSVGALRESAKSEGPASDIAFIFGFMKMLDPNSTVREGEFAQIEASRSAPGWFKAASRKVQSGQRLSVAEKARYLAVAEQLVKSRKASVAPIQKRYGALARQAGADSSLVAPDPFEGLDEEQASDAKLPPLTPTELAKAKSDPGFRRFLLDRGYRL